MDKPPGTATDPRPLSAATVMDEFFEDPEDLSGKTLLGRYRMMRICGRGGHSVVYEAEHLGLGGKKIAIKEMRSPHTEGPERTLALERFQDEARTLAGLSHPCLPRVTDFFSEGDRYYLVMEYVEGETLEERIRHVGGPIREDQALRWAAALCDVLGFLHSQHPPLVFRDLTLPNIMVNEKDHLTLIDFGIARTFKPGKNQDTHSMGTAGYCAPEQYGAGQTDPRSDIYALGACLHHLLTGRDPRTEPFKFPPVRELNSSITSNTESVIAKCVSLSPDERFSSVSAIRRALAPPYNERDTTGLPTVRPPKVGGIAAKHGRAISPAGASASGRRLSIREIPPTVAATILLSVAVIIVALFIAFNGR